MLAAAYIFLSTLLPVVLLALRDIPVVNGCTTASGAGEKIYMKILLPVAFLAVLIFTCMPNPGGNLIFGYVSDFPSGSLLLPVGIATLASVVLTLRISRFPAIQFAFVGSLFGLKSAYGSGPGWTESSACIISWIAAPLLCGVLAAGIYKLTVALVKGNSTHFIILESRLLKISTVAALLLVVAYAFNNSLVFNCLPIAEYGPGLRAASMTAGVAITGVLLSFRRAAAYRYTVADSDLDVESESILPVLLSMALVLALFCAGFLRRIGLCATPLPAGLLFIAALTGVSLARGRALVEGESIARCAFSAVLSPLLGAMFCYSLCRIIDGDLMNTLLVLGLAGIITAVVLFLQWQSRKKLQAQLISAREQQVYNARKSLSALEVKAEMTEKDLIGKLEFKRKELVDFAVGVSDQKRFMEKFYEDLKSVRYMSDGKDKDAGLDRLLSTLRERMYFSREMNDFYARTEVLHKDFNMRLSEAYPNLTENEKKLANLLRQGFSSKYIASLMNITPKSAEINRYRLRAKLGLKRSDNLVQFIKSI